MTVRPFAGSSTTSLLATTANGKVVLNTSTATATVTFTSTDTNIKAETYEYDFVFNSGSVITRLLEGRFIVTAGITV